MRATTASAALGVSDCFEKLSLTDRLRAPEATVVKLSDGHTTTAGASRDASGVGADRAAAVLDRHAVTV